MNISLKENCTLDKPGLYFIRNLANGKKYIGSSTMRIIKRLEHHYRELRRNNHKNIHLQNAWNSYGEENFTFEVIINLDKSQCFIVEQEYLNNALREEIYNINPMATGTPSLSAEVIEKRSKSIKKSHQERMLWVRAVKSGKVLIEEVPENFLKYVNSKLKQKSWNKGFTKETMDFSFLKGVKKTMTPEFVEARKKVSLQKRENSSEVYVYNLQNEYLGYWKNAFDLEEESKDPSFILNEKMILKNKVGRNGYSPNILKRFNVQKSMNKKIPYKGLIFSNQPLHEAICVE